MLKVGCWQSGLHHFHSDKGVLWHDWGKDGCSPFSISVPVCKERMENFGGSHGSLGRSREKRKSRHSEATLHLGHEPMESTKWRLSCLSHRKFWGTVLVGEKQTPPQGNTGATNNIEPDLLRTRPKGTPRHWLLPSLWVHFLPTPDPADAGDKVS